GGEPRARSSQRVDRAAHRDRRAHRQGPRRCRRGDRAAAAGEPAERVPALHGARAAATRAAEGPRRAGRRGQGALSDPAAPAARGKGPRLRARRLSRRRSAGRRHRDAAGPPVPDEQRGRLHDRPRAEVLRPMSQTLTRDVKRRLYHGMLLVRRTEERIQANYHLREMRSPPHLYMGHEAAAAGVCATLHRDDVVFPYYRSHGWYLAKGGDLDAMMAELYGRANGCSRGWGGSMHLIDVSAGVYGTSAIVGVTVSHAAGVALTYRIRGRDSVAVVSFGDGATEEGVFHETMNFAGLRRLPMVYVCENNLYATNTHIRDRQAQTEIWRHAERFGIPGRRLDGNDVVAVWRAATEAVGRARRGEGPSLLELETYRYFEHCGINEDLDLGYRTGDELKAWRARDPLVSRRRLVSDAE